MQFAVFLLWMSFGGSVSENRAAAGQANVRPSAPLVGPAGPLARPTEPLDVNTATREQMRRLPGMGEAYVDRVVAGRPYTAKNQLLQRGILPEAEYDRIRELVVARRVRAPEPARSSLAGGRRGPDSGRNFLLRGQGSLQVK